MDVYSRTNEINDRVVSVTFESESHEEERLLAAFIETIKESALISCKTRKRRVAMRFRKTKTKG